MMKWLNALLVFLFAAVAAACAQHGGTGNNKVTPPLTVEQQAQQHVAALRQAENEEKNYLKELAAAIRKEPRNEAWATAKEAELRKSYAEDEDVPEGTLKSIDCRRSRCEVQFELESIPLAEAKAQQVIAIDQWISWSQLCGYTITAEPGISQAPETIRVFLECSE